MPILKFLVLASLLLLLPHYAACAEERVTEEQADFFEKRVRPVLAEKCFACHGPEKQELGIRLDSRQAVLTGGDGGTIVEPGKPDESPLIIAIRYDDNIQMPPDEKLQPAEIEALTLWVKIGLPWPGKAETTDQKSEAFKRHWAYQPVLNPLPPDVNFSSWPRSALDRFILAKMEAAGLTPAPEANRRTLLRRATFDLTGLPPSPEETAAFMQDNTADAYEKLIDRLLASPHYGERWGRYWLDVARYADNKGYIFFGEKEYPWAYTYRDYVVRALNNDLPYDRFISEQLAADQLELGEDKRPLAAMGFLTLGARFSGNVHDIIDDRIDVITRGLMGLTVTCSRCHDHKFDPVGMPDYYGLYGVLRSSTEPTIQPLFEPPPQSERFQKFSIRLEHLQQKLNDFATAKHQELITSSRKCAAEYLLAAHAKRHQPPTEDFMLLVDAGDLNPTMIQRWQSYLEQTRKSRNRVWGVWHACAEIPPEDFSASFQRILDEAQQRSSAADLCHPLVFESLRVAAPTNMQEFAEVYSELLNRIDAKWLALLKEAADSNQPVPTSLADPVEEELRQVFYGEDSPPEVPMLTGWGFLTLLPDRPAQEEYKKLLADVQSHLSGFAGAPPRAMVMYDAPQAYEPHIFLRGNPNRPGLEVPRQFPRFLTAAGSRIFEKGSGRLELAEAIVDPDNPLTARVLVNRVWLQHFGQALVQTPSDFGMRSDPPTHPLLLDHLAAEFMQDGWSLKRLHRRIMLSAAYRQSSDKRTDAAQVDPQNRLLWRMNRRRLDFEALRDSLLAVSGDLDRKLGGPAVDIERTTFSPRRTIYAFVDRMDLPELFRAFDFPDPAATSPQRDTTTIAPQALYFMNHQFIGEVAQRIAARPDVNTLAENSSRVRRLSQILLGRPPSDDEMELADGFLGSHPTGKQWQQYIQALLMTNEFVFVD